MAIRKSVKLLIGIPLAVIAIVVIGTWTYINLIREDAPDRLTLDSGTETEESSTSTTTGSSDSTASTGSAASASQDGTWNVGTGSTAGYRVKEVLFGQSTEGVGRTSDVTGSIKIGGSEVTSGSFTVDLTTVKSDESRRDAQFKGRIMEVDTYPTATFELTEPIDLDSVPAEGKKITTTATGKLTLHGTTKTIDVEVEAERTGSTIRIVGNIPIVFDEWGIDNPSGGPAQTEDNGEIEFLLVLKK